MTLRVPILVVAAAWAAISLTTSSADAELKTNGAIQEPAPKPRAGWTIPAGAREEKNPLPINDSVLAAGRKVFASNCQRCHGPKGKGDGEDAEKEHAEQMDLTNPERASVNPPGVMFHKIWNGRSSPKMPRFSEELSKEQVWAVVAFTESLRVKK